MFRVFGERQIMNNRIEFHPRRLSHSKSKEKYSPYRKQKSKSKYNEAVENREKMILQEPIIKFKSLLENTSKPSKLKLGSQPVQDSRQPYTTHFSNYFYNTAQPTDQNAVIQQLIQKIDQQNESIKQNFKQINQQLKLPKIAQKEEPSIQKEVIKSYADTQQKIIKYLQTLTQVNKENSQLKELLQKQQAEIRALKEDLESTKSQCLWLLQELSTAKMAGLAQLQESPIFKKENSQEKPSLMSSIQGHEKDTFNTVLSKSQKSIQSDINAYEELLSKKEGQINQLKLQNEILSEQVKLLNYTIEEMEAQISRLNLKSSPLEDINRSGVEGKAHILINNKRQPFSKEKTSKSDDEYEEASSEVQKILIDQSLRTKKTNSFIMSGGESIINLQQLNHQFERTPNRRKTSNDQISIGPVNIRKSFSGKAATNSNSFSVDLRNQGTETDKHKIDMGRSFLKIKAKGNSESRGKKKQKRFWHFDAFTMHHLQVIRTTIGFKLRGFRYKLSDFEHEMINSKIQLMSSEQMRKHLEEHPFLLSEHLISVIQQYIFKKFPEGQTSIKTDEFCKYLREFIPIYDICSEQVEKVALDKIKMFIESSWKELTHQIQRLCESPGLVSHKSLKTVLKQFKMSDLEIELLISQCCMISTDSEHLDYELYFNLFQEEDSENSF